MKPLPTLTKPLRSVDTETKEPAQALRERTDSCTVPAAGVVGEAMVALVLAAAYREKFGGDHIDDVRAALGRIRGAHRLEARIALVLVGFMGAGKSTGARSLAAELGAEPLDSDRELERRLGEPVESFFDREGEHAFRAREEELVLELLSRGGRARGGARRRRARLGARARGARPRTPWSTSRSSRARPGGGRPARAARWRATRAASRSSTAIASRSTSRWRTRSLPPCDRDALRRALPALRALEAAPPGTRLVWAPARRASTRSSSGAG